MAKVLEMPKLSPTMEEGQISLWHMKEGDPVGVDDLLAEVETDKATMEYRSFDRGTLLRILAPGGSVVRLGQPVAVLGAPGEDIAALLASLLGSSPVAADALPLAAAHPPSVADVVAAPPAGPAGDEPPTGRAKASPYVRKLARERGLDLGLVSGSGPGGRIVARDVEGLPEAVPAPAPRPESGVLAAPIARPLSMMRKAIARRLTESKQTVPHFYLTIDVDADPIWSLREQINADLAAAAHADAPVIKVSLNDLLVKASAIALARVPECNAEFTPEAILIHRRVDISVAVAVSAGLLPPVVRDADRKSVMAIAAEIRELSSRAKARKLAPSEMANGTFSISNLGMYGIDEFAAVINPPEGAILAVGQVRREPVLRGDAIVPGRRLKLTLSCDHRVVDGAVGAEFLRALRALVEHPTRILLA